MFSVLDLGRTSTNCYRTWSSKLWCCQLQENISVVIVPIHISRKTSPRRRKRRVKQDRLLQVQTVLSIYSAVAVTPRTWRRRQAARLLLRHPCTPAIYQLHRQAIYGRHIVRKSMRQQRHPAGKTYIAEILLLYRRPITPYRSYIAHATTVRYLDATKVSLLWYRQTLHAQPAISIRYPTDIGAM